jgi:hypothetical protein
MESSTALVNLKVSNSVSFFSSKVRSISTGIPMIKVFGIPFSLTMTMGKMGAPLSLAAGSRKALEIPLKIHFHAPLRRLLGGAGFKKIRRNTLKIS